MTVSPAIGRNGEDGALARPRLVFFFAKALGSEGKRVHGRLESPRGCRDIEQLLAPWLR